MEHWPKIDETMAPVGPQPTTMISLVSIGSESVYAMTTRYSTRMYANDALVDTS